MVHAERFWVLLTRSLHGALQRNVYRQSYFYDSMYLFKKTCNCVTSWKQLELSLLLRVSCLALSYIQRRREPCERNRCFPQVCLHSSSPAPGEKGLLACMCTDPQCVLPGIASRLGILGKSRLLSSLQTDKYCWCGWPWCNFYLPLKQSKLKCNICF